MKDLFTTFKNVGKGGILTTEGIGIGLSTAKTLANVMGGFITVKSVEEVGTSITFALQMRNRRCSID
jgi:signal transduction histidine kinase